MGGLDFKSHSMNQRPHSEFRAKSDAATSILIEIFPSWIVIMIARWVSAYFYHVIKLSFPVQLVKFEIWIATSIR